MPGRHIPSSSSGPAPWSLSHTRLPGIMIARTSLILERVERKGAGSDGTTCGRAVLLSIPSIHHLPPQRSSISCSVVLPFSVSLVRRAWPQDTDPSDGGVLNAINVLQMSVQESADRDYASFFRKMRRAAILCRGGNGRGRVGS